MCQKAVRARTPSIRADLAHLKSLAIAVMLCTGDLAVTRRHWNARTVTGEKDGHRFFGYQFLVVLPEKTDDTRINRTAGAGGACIQTRVSFVPPGFG